MIQTFEDTHTNLHTKVRGLRIKFPDQDFLLSFVQSANPLVVTFNGSRYTRAAFVKSEISSSPLVLRSSSSSSFVLKFPTKNFDRRSIRNRNQRCMQPEFANRAIWLKFEKTSPEVIILGISRIMKLFFSRVPEKR